VIDPDSDTLSDVAPAAAGAVVVKTTFGEFGSFETSNVVPAGIATAVAETLSVVGVPVPDAAVVNASTLSIAPPAGIDVVIGPDSDTLSDVAPAAASAVVLNTTLGEFGSPEISNDVPDAIEDDSGETDSVVGVPVPDAAVVTALDRNSDPGNVGATVVACGDTEMRLPAVARLSWSTAITAEFPKIDWL
jgi:hypothetical protein